LAVSLALASGKSLHLKYGATSSSSSGEFDAAQHASQGASLTDRAACAAWGITMSVLIPDSPYETKRFTREEKIIIMSRKRGDYHNVEKRQIKWKQVFECAKDPKMWLYFFLGLTANIVSRPLCSRNSARGIGTDI
jgi:hypothetical protein